MPGGLGSPLVNKDSKRGRLEKGWEGGMTDEAGQQHRLDYKGLACHAAMGSHWQAAAGQWQEWIGVLEGCQSGG